MTEDTTQGIYNVSRTSCKKSISYRDLIDGYEKKLDGGNSTFDATLQLPGWLWNSHVRLFPRQMILT